MKLIVRLFESTVQPVVPTSVTAYVTAPASDEAAAKVAPDCGIVSAVVGAHEIVVDPRLTMKP